MHELGIAEGILRASIKGAEDAGATRINDVDVIIGELTEIMEDALQFAWESIRAGTMADQALLHVSFIKPLSACADCGHEFEHGRYDGARCPACGSFVVVLQRGRELTIDSIDID